VIRLLSFLHYFTNSGSPGRQVLWSPSSIPICWDLKTRHPVSLRGRTRAAADRINRVSRSSLSRGWSAASCFPCRSAAWDQNRCRRNRRRSVAVPPYCCRCRETSVISLMPGRYPVSIGKNAKDIIPFKIPHHLVTLPRPNMTPFHYQLKNILIPRLSLLFRSRDSPPDGIQQGLIIDGFSKKSRRSESLCMFTGLCIIAGGNHNDRHPYSS